MNNTNYDINVMRNIILESQHLFFVSRNENSLYKNATKGIDVAIDESASFHEAKEIVEKAKV